MEKSMDWKATIKQLIPPFVLNRTLLTFPFLYRTEMVNFETNISAGGGIDDLLSQLDLVLEMDGNIIECGSSRCGTSIIMANYLRAKGKVKSVYACDSFEGFDKNELKRERAKGLTTAGEKSFTSTSYRYVSTKLERLGLYNTVIPIKGFFQDTLPHISSKFCIALVDCDLTDSIMYSAETIWPKLVRGGRILFDDYTDEDFKGARLGIDQFVLEHDDEIERHGLLKRLYLVKKA
jgi:O-methyltransferase